MPVLCTGQAKALIVRSADQPYQDDFKLSTSLTSRRPESLPEREPAEAQTAYAELAQEGAGTTAQLAAVVLART